MYEYIGNVRLTVNKLIHDEVIREMLGHISEKSDLMKTDKKKQINPWQKTDRWPGTLTF